NSHLNTYLSALTRDSFDQNRLMQNDEDSRTSNPPRHSHDDSGEASLFAKLVLWLAAFVPMQKDRLEKLAGWRIDPSLINFPKGGSELRGGNATVSRAFLASSHIVEVRSQSGAGSGDDVVQPEGHDLQNGNRVSISDADDLCQEREGSNENTKSKSGDAIKEQEQGFNDETARLGK
ncbi:hypothetical protein FRC01_006271, partial [Tulasnella sp. 417]